MKKILTLTLSLVLAGCGELPAGPQQAASVTTPASAGVLRVRVIGPLSVLPLGFQLPLNGRGLRLVVTDASGGPLVNQGRALLEGGAFSDSFLTVVPGTGRVVQATITDETGAVVAAGQAQGVTVTSNAFTDVTVVLAPVARQG